MALVTRVVPAALALASMVAGVSPTIGSAATPVRFDLHVGSGCIGGEGPERARIAFRWRDADGRRRTDDTLHTDADGTIDACFHRTIRPGDRLIATVDGATHRLRVPELTARIDRVRDTVSGRAPAGSDLTLDAASESGHGHLIWQFVVEPHAGYVVDLADGGFDMAGCDTMSLRWRGNLGDSVTAHFTSPCLSVVVGRASGPQATGLGKATTGEVTLDLLDAQGVLKGTAHAAVKPTSAFAARFRDADGEPVWVRPGDRVSSTGIARDAAFTVPNVTLRARAATDRVSGSCQPGARYAAEAYAIASSLDWYREGQADEEGLFARTLPSRFNLTPGDVATVACHLSTGDRVTRSAVVR